MIARCFFLLIFRLVSLTRTNRGQCTTAIDVTFNIGCSRFTANFNQRRTGDGARGIVTIRIITIRVFSDTRTSTEYMTTST